MDTIAYIANRKFLIVAVDTNFQVTHGDLFISSKNTRKAHVLNSKNLITVVGNPYQNSDILAYIKKISALDSALSFDQIIEDLRSVFDSSHLEMIRIVQEVAKVLPTFQEENGNISKGKLLAHFEGRDEHLALLNNALENVGGSPLDMVTFVGLFGWDEVSQQCRVANYVSLGNSLSGDETEFLDEFVYTKFVSRNILPEETSKLELESVKELSPFLVHGWDTNQTLIEEMMERCKQILVRAIKKISPYAVEPNVVFYELSHRTHFNWQEPDMKLFDVVYKRGKSESDSE